MFEKNQRKLKIINNNSDVIVRKLNEACEGLIYVSEADAPVRVFSGEVAAHVSRSTVLRQTGSKAEETVAEPAFDQFFSRLTAIQPWFGENESARAKKFLDLQKLIEENLSDLKVFKIGRVQIRIYVVGLDADGRLTGVVTGAVET